MAQFKVPTVTEYFKDIGSNLTKVKWAHAVNSPEKLSDAINNAQIHMIEADVRFKDGEPILSHDKTLSNETFKLDQFLATLKDNSTTAKKGLKLDFKEDEAIEPSVKVLEKYIDSNFSIPIWLNADILSGKNVSSPTPITPKTLLTAISEKSEGIVYSVGWTTTCPGENYDSQNLEDMRKTLKENNVTLSITYPIRACLAGNDKSIAAFGKIDKTKESITIWSGVDDTDKVNVKKISELIKTVGVANVYLDVPDDLYAKLETSGVANLVPYSMTLMMMIFAAFYSIKML